MRFVTAALALLLAAPSLFAEARIARNSTTPAEAVNWTAGVSYTYDGSGNITTIGGDRFAYDRVGRVSRADVKETTRVYAYDAFGNRTGCTHEPGEPEQSDCQFGIAVDSANNRMKNVTYDASGGAEEFAGHRYTYDALDMPVRDEKGPAVREFIYTAEDERIVIVNNNASWQWAVRDFDGKVLRELTSSGAASFSWSRDYVYRDGQLVASRHVANLTPVTYHYHLDHLGTARRITDHTNRTVGFHDYYAFGPEISGGLTEPVAASLQYTGHERDKGSNAGGLDTLDYMLARYYSPAMGRFLVVDPAGNFDYSRPQSFNRYAYAGNDPINFVDPDGETRKIFGWIVKYVGKRHIKIRPVFSNKEAARALRQNHQVDVARRQRAVAAQRPNSKGKRPVKDPAHPDADGSTEGRYPHAHSADRSGGHAAWSKELVGAVIGVALSAFNLDADEIDPVEGRVLNEQFEQVSIWVYGKSFGDLTPDQQKDVAEIWSGRKPLPDKPHAERDPVPVLPPAGACISGQPACR